jgi:hypothetical protein
MAQRATQREARKDLHRQILDVLLEKVKQDPYPSVTVLDLIEQRLRPDDVDEYTEILMDKVKDDAFPSLDHLQRLMRFA